MRKARQQGNSRHGDIHSTGSAARLYRRARLVAWSVAIAVLLAWASPPAVAQVDPCVLLTNELEKIANQAVKNLAEKDKPKELNRNNMPRYAVDDLVSKLAPFHAEVSNKKLASGNLASVTFEGKRIVDVQAADPGKICVKAYVPAASKPDVPIRQLTPVEKDQVKGLKVVFKIDAPSTHWYWPWADVDYLVFGVIAATPATTPAATPATTPAATPAATPATTPATTPAATPAATPPTTSPTFFSHRATVTVADYWEILILSWLFVAGFYAFLAWTTYPDKSDAKKPGEASDGKKPVAAKKPDDLKELTEGKWLLFALSPVRISAAWFGEASMSQLQVLIFTVVVAGLMFNLLLGTGTLSELSMDLLKLIGISAVGTAGAKFTQTLKTGLKAETAGFLIGKGWYQWDLRAIQHTATLRQLLLTDNRLDVYKFQMLIFTVVVALYVMSAGQTGLSEVKISDTMLYLIGISQVVYVGGKAVTDRTTDLENAVAKMRELEPKLKDAKAKAKAKALTLEQEQWLAEYRRAAEAAAEEFAFLQNRIYPRANPDDPNSKPDPKILVPTPGLKSVA